MAPHIWVARGRLCPDSGALWGRAQPNRDNTPPTSSAPLYRLNHSKGLIGGTGEPRELADKAAIKAMLVNRVGDFGLAPLCKAKTVSKTKAKNSLLEGLKRSR
ncbi:hypothetical protein Tco_0228187, partial [Tanacetum coccineum]